MCTISFTQQWPAELGEDDAVVRHELGHALVWLEQGNLVEQVRFTRTADLLLGGATKFGLPDGLDEARLRKQRPAQLAERILAGEIAAREHVGLTHGEICTELALRPGNDLSVVLANQESNPADDIKALFLAYEAAGPEWYAWLCERHAAARAQVLECWGVLDNAAELVLADIPLIRGEELLIRSACVAQLLGFGHSSGL